MEEIPPRGQDAVGHRVGPAFDPRRDQGQLGGLAEVPDVAVPEAPTAAAGDKRHAPLAASQELGAGDPVVRPEHVAGPEDDDREAVGGMPVAELVLRPDLVAHVGHEGRRTARPLLRDVASVEAERQRRRNVDEAPQGRAGRADPADEAPRHIEDVPIALLVAGRVGDERGGMDDVGRPGRQVDPLGEAEVARDEPDVETFEEVEIGGFPDEGVDLPAPARGTSGRGWSR